MQMLRVLEHVIVQKQVIPCYMKLRIVRVHFLVFLMLCIMLCINRILMRISIMMVRGTEPQN